MSGEPALLALGVGDADRARRLDGALLGWTFAPGPAGVEGSPIRTPDVPGADGPA